MPPASNNPTDDVQNKPAPTTGGNGAASAVPANNAVPAGDIPASAQNQPVENPVVALVLPTNTATTAPTATPTVALPTETPTPAPSATPTPTATPSDWQFENVRVYTGLINNGLLLFGNLVNNTGAPQELEAIDGTFYDAASQQIAAASIGLAYWPGYIVPPGGGVPFQLEVDNISSVGNFDLQVEARASDTAPMLDFTVSNSSPRTEGDSFCVSGRLQNPGPQLEDYLVVALVLYDDQNNVISFSDYEELDPDWIRGDESLEYELCADLLAGNVARHVVQAWGR